jgi:hypothetical protein
MLDCKEIAVRIAAIVAAVGKERKPNCNYFVLID